MAGGADKEQVFPGSDIPAPPMAIPAVLTAVTGTPIMADRQLLRYSSDR
jgi:hypothetical protein